MVEAVAVMAVVRHVLAVVRAGEAIKVGQPNGLVFQGVQGEVEIQEAVQIVKVLREKCLGTHDSSISPRTCRVRNTHVGPPT